MRDDSELGRLRALAAAAAAPDAGAKRDRLDALFAADAGVSLARARAVAGGLFPVTQQALLVELTPRILDGLERLSAERDSQYLEELTERLVQPVCRRSYVRRLDAALENAAWMPPTVERDVRDNRFEAARCLAIGAELEAD